MRAKNQTTQAIAAATFTLLVAAYLFLLWLYSPGFVSSDNMMVIQRVLQNELSELHSLTYSVTLWMLLKTWRNLLGLSFLHLACYFTLVGLTLFHVAKLKSWRLVLALCAFVLIYGLWPYHQALILFQNRDVLFSLILVLCSLYFWMDSVQNSPRAIPILAFTIAYLSDLRPEGQIYILFFPLFAFLFKFWDKKQTLKFCAWLALFAVSILVIWPRLFGYDSFRQDYQTTTIVQPLGEIYAAQPVESLYPDLHEKIEKVLNTKMLRDEHSPYEIFAFHDGAFRGHVPAREWKEFKSAVYSVYFKFPKDWFEARSKLFLCMINVSEKQPFNFGDAFRFSEDNYKDVRQALDLHIPPPSSFEQWHMGWLSLMHNHQNQLSRILFFSMILPMLFMVLVCVRGRRAPKCAFAASLILIRVPLLFLIAPASYTKYVYPIPLLFLALVPLFVVELKPKT